MIRRGCDAHPPANRSSRSRIPGDIDVVTQSAAGAQIRRNHRLVVKVIGAALKRKEVDRGISFAAVRRFGDGHFGSVDAVSVSEEDHDVAVEDGSLRIESERWI